MFADIPGQRGPRMKRTLQHDATSERLATWYAVAALVPLALTLLVTVGIPGSQVYALGVGAVGVAAATAAHGLIAVRRPLPLDQDSPRGRAEMDDRGELFVRIITAHFAAMTVAFLAFVTASTFV